MLGAGAGLLGAMYLLDVLGKLAPAVSELRWLSAFRYYGTPLTDGLDVARLAVLVAAGGAARRGRRGAHERRDITGSTPNRNSHRQRSGGAWRESVRYERQTRQRSTHGAGPGEHAATRTAPHPHRCSSTTRSLPETTREGASTI